jgi:hypothetical protein
MEPVTIADIRIPFWRLVVFFVKCSIAAIPAAIILGLLYALIGIVVVGIFAAIGIDWQGMISSRTPA